MHKSNYRYLYWQIPGWFPLVDFTLMEMIGNFQDRTSIHGPILEIGCYKGKSAILLGKLLGESEKLFLVDLFEGIGTDSLMDTPLYKGLTQQTLERNLDHFQVNATVLKIDSKNITDSLSTRNFRIIHIDAGHTYGPVSKDLESGLSMIKEDGIIILDDYRNISFPGMWVAFAEFTANRDISVLFATETKAYFVKTKYLESYMPLIEKIELSQQFRILSTSGDHYITLGFNRILSFVQKLYSTAGLLSIHVSNFKDKIRLQV